MAYALVGEWDLFKGESGDAPLERIEFLEEDGALRVRYVDTDTAQHLARVQLDGDTARFEILSAGSSRGNAHYTYELTLTGPAGVAGTRRRGLLAKAPVTGRRVAASAPSPAPPGTELAIAGGASLAEAKARAAEAAERAAQAAAEAAAAQAEVEAAAALEAARRAAARAAAARANLAAVGTGPGPIPMASGPAPVTPARRAIPPDMLALIPAPTQAPAVAPTVPGATGARIHRLRVTHRIDFGGSTVSAVEVFPGVFLWGESYATSADRLREVGWVATAVQTDEVLDVDERRIVEAATLRDALAG